MKLIFNEIYKSISPFNAVECPDFTVLTGINGSGKSHLLEAIELRKVLIEGVEREKIVYFDYKTFALDEEVGIDYHQLTSERESAWNLWNSQIKGSLQQWEGEFLTQGGTSTEVWELCETNKCGLWELGLYLQDEDPLKEKLREFKRRITAHFQNNNLKENQEGKSILVMIKNSRQSLINWSQPNFFLSYKPYHFKNDFLPTKIGKVIWDYFIRWIENDYDTYRKEKHGDQVDVLTEDEFKKTYGPPPWDMINEILMTFSAMEYRVRPPVGLSPFRDRYSARLDHTVESLSIDYGNLSSGEKVLMALVASIYKSASDMHFPSALLLDEIDASLHPSMIKNLLDVINSVFIRRGTKVILVTHSPTTIALAEDSSIYIMNKRGQDRIVKKPKGDALSILTEGFATLEEGLKIFDQVAQVQVTVITEGANSTYLTKALELLAPDLAGKAEILKGAEEISGQSQLKTLFDFFKAVPHSNVALFVWDTDVTTQYTGGNKTVPFVFEKNPTNTKYRKGIENLFDDLHFVPEVYSQKPNSEGGESSYVDKRKFMTRILNVGTAADFYRFQPFVDLVREQVVP